MGMGFAGQRFIQLNTLPTAINPHTSMGRPVTKTVGIPMVGVVGPINSPESRPINGLGPSKGMIGVVGIIHPIQCTGVPAIITVGE